MLKKRKLTQQQEFEILKLVLDKFLWLGFVVMAYGGYILFKTGFSNIGESLSLLIAGAVILLIFIAIMVREYEIIKFRS
ncbi:MAG: hypothetical protein N3D84_02850 [Candidatus Woesearchaeota archaeon]|nr:hypothetical protein [Candidatus Woesearchaeota archaeon]